MDQTFYISGWASPATFESLAWLTDVSSDMPHSVSRITTQFCPSFGVCFRENEANKFLETAEPKT